MKKFSLFFGLLFLWQASIHAQDTLPAPTSYRVNKVSFNMVRVEKGGFWMGAQRKDTAEFNYDRQSQIDELPVHYVTMREDYYIGQTEVTQKLWKAVMGYNPSRYKCPKRPVPRGGSAPWTRNTVFRIRPSGLPSRFVLF